MPGARATYATVYAASMSLRRLKKAQGPLGRPKAAKTHSDSTRICAEFYTHTHTHTHIFTCIKALLIARLLSSSYLCRGLKHSPPPPSAPRPVTLACIRQHTSAYVKHAHPLRPRAVTPRVLHHFLPSQYLYFFTSKASNLRPVTLLTQ